MYNDGTINRCPYGFGHCVAERLHAECIMEFDKGIEPTGTGCGYANGIAVYETDIHDGVIAIECRNGGCKCYWEPWELAGWNQKCPYNDECDWQWQIK